MTGQKLSLNDEDYVAMGAFRVALRRFLAFSEARALEAGVTAQQHQALLAIKAHHGPQPMTMGELADSLLIKNHSAIGLVARLAERGLATREPSEIDRRRVSLHITAAGEAVLAQITHKNFSELTSTAPIFIELLSAVQRLER